MEHFQAMSQPVPISAWVAGARVRTLPAALVPVAVGTGVAAAEGQVIWWRAALAALVALSLQIGTNYANDHSDGVRGTDQARVGPLRLVGSGTATATQVRDAALLAFGVAAVGGLVLAVVTSWWLVPVGALSMAAGWLYTGGPRPYGYMGLGEVFVFVFFGLVATTGTAYVQVGRVSGLALAASVPVGLAAVALLVTNNLRDIPGDSASGKRTLAVTLGDRGTRVLYTAVVVGVFLGGASLAFSRPGALLCLAAVPLAVPPVRAVLSGAEGVELIGVLAATGRLQLAVGILLASGLAL